MINLIFIHGLESTGKGFKGQFFQKTFPGCLTPDFKEFDTNITYQELLNIRMTQLIELLEKKDSWIIIGSSFGGLMGTLYTLKFPKKVKKLILLAPFLDTPILNPEKFHPIEIPVIIYHGKNDNIVPLNSSRSIAKKLFKKLTYNIVDDDHMLQSTVVRIEWSKIILEI